MKINSQQSTLNSSDVKINTNQPLNLNSATEEQLKNIPGIGPSKAKEILNYREQNHGFNSIDDLMKIKFYLLNDNNNDLIQNSQERQSKISDQQIKNSKS